MLRYLKELQGLHKRETNYAELIPAASTNASPSEACKVTSQGHDFAQSKKEQFLKFKYPSYRWPKKILRPLNLTNCVANCIIC